MSMPRFHRTVYKNKIFSVINDKIPIPLWMAELDRRGKDMKHFPPTDNDQATKTSAR